MRRPDKSIYGIVCAAIRRKAGHFDTWQHTKFWENIADDVRQELSARCDLADGEIPILSVCFDQENWIVFSTRYIYYSTGEKQDRIATEDVSGWEFGDFKGYRTKIEAATVFTKDGQEHWFLYEPGYPSMGAIYALMTLAQIT
jgi:hypothetical protein